MEIRNLRVNGRMGMIVANKWMRAGYGEKLRDFLQRIGQPLEVIDFGHAPIFPDADTFPCILIVTKRPRPLAEKEKPADDETMTACAVPRERWHDRIDLAAFVTERRYCIPTRLLRKEGWSLENPKVQELLEKIRRTGLALKDYCGAPLYGVKTGCNEAFIIDASTRDRLVRESKRSEEIIRPLLRGRDIDRWRPRDSGMYMIVARRGIDIDHYPAVKRHLQQFQERLEPKPQNWNERQGEWSGRAAGDYAWYELQASPGDRALAALQGKKIVYQDLAWFSEFAFDGVGLLPNNTVYLIPASDPTLMAVLNSPVWWFMWRTAQHAKDEVLRLFTDYVENLPIPSLADKARAALSDCAGQVIEVADEVQTFDTEVIETAGDRFTLPEADGRVVSWLPLPTDTFVSRFLKLAGVKQPTPKLRDEIAVFQQSHRTRQVELLTQQLELEMKLAGLVEDAYGLTPEERSLLRSTRPVRDPLDVLETKVRGGSVVAKEQVEED